MPHKIFDPIPTLLLPILVFLFRPSSAASAAINPQYTECSKPVRCDNINVSYPFTLPDSPTYCGAPGYELNCDRGSNLTINLAGDVYRVMDINYEQRFFTAVDADFFGSSCPQTFRNTSFNRTLFDLSNLDSIVTVYVNCTRSVSPPGFRQIPCMKNSISYFNLQKGPTSEVLDLLLSCQLTAAVPLYESAALSLNSSSPVFGGALRQGFGMKWSAGNDWCRGCIDVGGVCGYNSTRATDPICFCPKQTALGSCAYGKRKKKNTRVIAVISGGVAFLLSFTLFALLLQIRIRKLKASNIRLSMAEELSNAEIKMIDFSALKKATHNFDIQNKLGQGGFGPVYKGVLNGVEIAVKRLSATSSQGLQEMKNEIQFVANLRHKNLVRLLGYCLHREEKLLIYEFLPNTSLDKFLFNPIRKTQLDWETRLKIILGVGRGLLYLHEDSHLRIVHRDLKASNILLDSDMNPKISDFGLAKLFKINETERNTSRIAGTLGYMAPEYVLHGRFSIKSDVFSYGVLVLEIITGMKLSMYESEEANDLQSYVWQHWREGNALEVVDGSLENRYSAQQVLRCVQIGLLCVQEDQMMRPKMDLVVTMLSSSSMKLPDPSMPTSYKEFSQFSVVKVESAPISGGHSSLEVGR
ncbi:Cysteine-rich receptor-like protein kinase 10 [Platanthera zijinensis]|uniref:Cysteine-rich receptor-like protein kinase 10 n=1 Tax=Platanthera zijinensis TaxID=2320716 RepID=A0AAP0BIF0_9ASPA